MSGRPLEALLRVRIHAEEKAAAAHGRAVSTRRACQEVAARAAGAWEAAADRAPTEVLSAAALHRSGLHLRSLADAAHAERRRLADALRAENATRDALLAARRAVRSVAALRDRALERERRAREAGEEEELAEGAALARWQRSGELAQEPETCLIRPPPLHSSG